MADDKALNKIVNEGLNHFKSQKDRIWFTVRRPPVKLFLILSDSTAVYCFKHTHINKRGHYAMGSKIR